MEVTFTDYKVEVECVFCKERYVMTPVEGIMVMRIVARLLTEEIECLFTK